MRIYVLRHGEAEDDIEDAYGGCANFRLTETGREQATALGGLLADAGIVAVYSSPLARALETAEIIVKELGRDIPLSVVPDLRERNSYGVLSGLSKARAAQVFDYILAELKTKPGYSREPLLGAEDFDEFVGRVRRGFEQVVKQSAVDALDVIAIVTHGKFTQALTEFVFELGDAVDLELSEALVVDYVPATISLVAD